MDKIQHLETQIDFLYRDNKKKRNLCMVDGYTNEARSRGRGMGYHRWCEECSHEVWEPMTWDEAGKYRRIEDYAGMIFAVPYRGRQYYTENNNHRCALYESYNDIRKPGKTMYLVNDSEVTPCKVTLKLTNN